jgi:uncharacterized protein (TIGR02145 family)
LCFSNLNAQETLKDYDGNVYKTIKIHDQAWMTENLNVSHYRNGDIIPQVQDSVKWAKLETGGWCYCNFKAGDHVVKGKLYNGYAVMDPRGIAPSGWTLPKWKDWSNLYNWRTDSSKGYLTDDTTRERLFLREDISTTNCSKNKCFYRRDNAAFGSMKCLGLWWLPEDEDLTFQLSRCEGYDGLYFSMAGIPKKWKNYGFFIRCIKR